MPYQSLPLTKEDKGGFERTGKNRISNHLPLSKKRIIKKIKLMRLPRHFVPRNDDLEFLLPWWEKVKMRMKFIPWQIFV